MLTDQRLEEFLFISEGGNRIAYDDFNPRKVLQPGDEIKGTLTYGPGFITRPDGSPVQIGDTMTDQEAYDRIRKYIRDVIEPTLEDLIHVPIATTLANALGSLVYNFGPSKVYGWRLWGRINSGEPVGNIIEEWITDTYYSKGVAMLGLLRRRFKELALAMDVDWRAGDNIDWETDPEEFLQVLGWDGTMPKPDPIVDEDLFKELEIPPMKKQVITDPTPATPFTTEDLNYVQLRERGSTMSFDEFRALGKKPVVRKNKVVIVPDTGQDDDLMEDSKTFNGLATKRIAQRGTAGGGAVLAGSGAVAIYQGLQDTTNTVKGLTKTTSEVRDVATGASDFVLSFTLNQLLITGLVIGGAAVVIYGVRWWWGSNQAWEGRLREGAKGKV